MKGSKPNLIMIVQYLDLKSEEFGGGDGEYNIVKQNLNIVFRAIPIFVSKSNLVGNVNVFVSVF